MKMYTNNNGKWNVHTVADYEVKAIIKAELCTVFTTAAELNEEVDGAFEFVSKKHPLGCTKDDVLVAVEEYIYNEQFD